MIQCKELSDKVVRLVTIYEDGTYGPEVHIEFTDGTTFSACLKTNISIEAKYIHDQGGEPCILRDYSPDYRRWTDPEFELVREELVKGTVEQVAKKLNRTPKAIRNMLRRNQLSLREIRCDLFSVESLATVLRVRKSEIVHWIEQGWLEATVGSRGKRHFYIIMPEALIKLYKQHQADLLKRGIRNQALFEAYLQYCYSPKHTVGEQLLDVRRDKRERAAFAAAVSSACEPEEEEEKDDYDRDDEEDEGPSLLDLETLDESSED
jgi:hypothetical protein